MIALHTKNIVECLYFHLIPNPDLVYPLARQVAHFQIPDPGGAVLAAGVHPPPVLLEPDRHHVLADAAVVDHGVEVARGEVEHPDVLVASRGQHAAVPGDCQTVHLEQNISASSLPLSSANPAPIPRKRAKGKDLMQQL